MKASVEWLLCFTPAMVCSLLAYAKYLCTKLKSTV